MSTGVPRSDSSRTVSSMTDRFRRPRKSIFSRPSFSTPCMSNWVTTRRESSRESLVSLSGR